MPLNRIPGEDNLYIGSAFAVGQQKLLDSHGITHILSVLQYTAGEKAAIGTRAHNARTRIFVDVDDVEEEDLLVHFPRIVRFIEGGLRPGPSESEASSTITGDPASAATENDDIEAVSTPAGAGAVYVHCAMGKSRSATAVIAFLLWKHPDRFRGEAAPGNSGSIYPAEVAEVAVQRALDSVREARPIAEPNLGFMKQLALWWRMGCPADSDDAVERQPIYQRWLYQKDVEESTRIGRAPGRLWFGDEEQQTGDGAQSGQGSAAESEEGTGDVQLRCKMCRRILAGSSFIIPHEPPAAQGRPCPHYFVEPLSWMRPVLEEGALDGRLVCPNAKCNASIGRYSWQGFKCTCREWVCPAFSLQQSKVDRVIIKDRAKATGNAHNIRLPPGAKGPSKV